MRVQPALEVPYLDAAGRRSVLKCPPWPSPLHLLGGVLSWDALTWTDRLKVLRIARPLMAARRSLRRNADAPGMPAEEASETEAAEPETCEPEAAEPKPKPEWETAGGRNLTPFGIDLHSGHDFRASVAYAGRTLSVTIRDLTIENAPESDVARVAREEGMLTLREDGLAKVREGYTSIEEVARVSV